MMEKLHAAGTQQTAFARIVDPLTYSNHRLLVGIALLAAAVHGVITLVATGNFFAAALQGFLVGLSSGAAWAFARELDPDHEASGLVAAAAGGVFALDWRVALVYIPLMFALRLVNRTGHGPAKFADTVIVVAAVALAGFTTTGVVAIIGAAAFLMDSILVKPLVRHRYAALVCALIAVFTLRGPFGWTETSVGAGLMGVMVLIVAFAWYTLRLDRVQTPADNGDELHLERVQSAMVIYTVGGALLVAAAGPAAVTSYWIIWASMTGPLVWAGVRAVQS
ncbi:MAG: hypothetical protein AAF125_08260 [Chloroflexota bacterium]